MADRIASVCATGAASSTRSAFFNASAMPSSPVAPMTSMMPNSLARAREAAERPMPTTLPTAPAFFSERANDPPIRPTPKMTTLFNMPYSASALVSAAISTAFSCGRPIETRSHSGSP